MKRSIPVIALVALTWLTACATLEQNTNRTIGTIAISVDSAMTSFGQWVRDGNGTISQLAEVKKRYEQYQHAMRIAQAGINAYRLSRDETTLRKTVAIASASAAELTTLIASLIQPSTKGP